jgi:hypothetical protein
MPVFKELDSMARATELQNKRDEKFHKYSWVIPVVLVLLTLGTFVVAFLIFAIAGLSALY